MKTKSYKKTTNSPIGWLGGKAILSPTICACMPKHKCYVEIFGGSMVVFFNKKISKVEIVNDIHEELINLMKVLSGTYFDEKIREEFVEYVRNMPASRAAFEEWKNWTTEQRQKLSPSQRAFMFYYCVKKSFSSTVRGGYEASPFASSRYNMNTEFDKFSQRFRKTNAQIERLDFRDLISKYNKSGSSTFFFGDPPYFVANDSNYYEFPFTNQDHIDFRNKCNEINAAKNMFMVTYDDVPEVIDLYSQFYIYRTDPIVYKSSEESGERTKFKKELIITNYDIGLEVYKKEKTFFEEEAEDITSITVHDHIGIELINKAK